MRSRLRGIRGRGGVGRWGLGGGEHTSTTIDSCARVVVLRGQAPYVAFQVGQGVRRWGELEGWQSEKRVGGPPCSAATSVFLPRHNW